MDRYLLAIAVAVFALLLVILLGSVLSVDVGETETFRTQQVVVHCRIIHENNASPASGVIVYATGSAISDTQGECTITAEGDKFVRLIVYPPGSDQKIVLVPVASGEREVNVVIPI